MRRFLVVSLFISLLWISSASAASITMKSGRTIEGDVTEKTAEYIKVQTKEQLWKIPLKELDVKTGELVKGLSVATPANPPAPPASPDLPSKPPAPTNNKVVSADRENVLMYLGQAAIVLTWSSATSEEFLKKLTTVKDGSNPDYFFGGQLSIQKKTLTLFKTLKVPEVPEIKKYHQDQLEAINILVKALEAGLNKDKSQYEQLATQVQSFLKSADEQKEKIIVLYGISEQDLQGLVSSGKLDIKWMEPIIKSKP